MTDRTATFDALCCAMAGPALLLMGCSPYYGAGSPYRESHGLGSSDLSEHPLFGRDDLANFESGASLGSERTRPDGTTADVGGGLPNVSALARLPVPLTGLSPTAIYGFYTGSESF